MSAKDYRAWLFTAMAGCTAIAAVAVATGDGAAAAPQPVRAAVSNVGYINPVAPAFDDTKDAKIRLRRHGVPTALERAWAYEGKHAGGNPQAAQMLAATERRALRTGRNPSRFKQAPATQTAKLLTVLVEFDPSGDGRLQRHDGAEDGVRGPDLRPRHAQNGPVHNKHPEPGQEGDPGQQHVLGQGLQPRALQQDALHQAGITQRVRTDLSGPDGSRASTSPATRCATITRRCPRAPTR